MLAWKPSKGSEVCSSQGEAAAISREGELVWIGVDPQEIPGGKRGPKLAFAQFRYFRKGEKVLSEIAPKLARAMRNRRFMLYGFSQGQEQEIKTILKLAIKSEPSALLFPKAADVRFHDHARCQKICRQERT